MWGGGFSQTTFAKFYGKFLGCFVIITAVVLGAVYSDEKSRGRHITAVVDTMTCFPCVRYGGFKPSAEIVLKDSGSSP